MTVMASWSWPSAARARGVVAAGFALGLIAATPAFARGPESVADLAEGLLDAVVNALEKVG